jgi:hypothetical protein
MPVARAQQLVATAHGVQAIQRGRQEYYEGYKVDLDNRRQQMKEGEEQRRAAEMAKIREDIHAGTHGKLTAVMGGPGDGDEDADEEE